MLWSPNYSSQLKGFLSFFPTTESSPFITSSPTIHSAIGSISTAKPIPRPLGASPLLSSPNSPLQTLLYRHPYLSGMNYLLSFAGAKNGIMGKIY